MKVKVLKNECYSVKGQKIEVKSGVQDLPDFVAESWLKQKRAEKVSSKKAAAPVENKMVNPVESDKKSKKA